MDSVKKEKSNKTWVWCIIILMLYVMVIMQANQDRTRFLHMQSLLSHALDVQYDYAKVLEKYKLGHWNKNGQFEIDENVY